MKSNKSLAVLALTLLVAACSSTTTTTTSNPSEPADAGSSATKNPTTKDPSGTDDSGSTGKTPSGSSDTAPCATECKDTACTSPPGNPDQACQTCLQQAVSGCQSALLKDCKANQDCMDWQACLGGCENSSGGNDAGAADAGSNPDQACTAKGSKNACQQCCVDNHSAGYQTFLTSLLTCACGN